MTREEFVKNCVSLGYCSKEVAEIYAEGREELSVDDYIDVYRKALRLKSRGKDGLHVCGTNGGKTSKSYKFYNGHEG